MPKMQVQTIPWPKKRRQTIYPLFLPWLGCKNRCIFCAQEVQTGVAAPVNQSAILRMLSGCRRDLAERKCAQAPQLAFYGGTFTAISESIWQECLDFAKRLQAEKLISGFRCSTRPDCLEPGRLEQLKAAGCQIVELGIQSFSDTALLRSGRGYNGNIALQACELVRNADLDLGVQLMPGMPGVDSATFLNDARLALKQGASCLRFYPCLVLAGSRLATLWRRGLYSPWETGQTIETLASAWLLAAESQTPVIRMGLAPQAGLDASILAGPVHKSLGSRVIGRALLFAVRKLLANAPERAALEVDIPSWLQGCRSGWQKELLPAWQALPVKKIRYWSKDAIRLQPLY